MSILKTLKLTTATRVNVAFPTEHAFRSKVLTYLAEQKAMAEAEIAGQPFNAKRTVTRTNEAGEKVRVEAPRKVRKGWFTDANGKMFFQVRYGSKPLELAKGLNAVEVENLAALPTVIASIIQAVLAGELDAQAKAAIADRKVQRKAKQAAA